MPQILIMENVPDVIGSNNIKHFAQWVGKLAKLGYTSKWQCLNGKNYGVPQNRDRCFMVSWLGDYYYDFPQPIKLEKRLKDVLETNVDSKYYLSEQQIVKAKNSTYECSKLENRIAVDGIMPTLRARDYKGQKLVEEPRCCCVGMLGGKYENMHDISRRVYSTDGLAPTMHTCGKGFLWRGGTPSV